MRLLTDADIIEMAELRHPARPRFTARHLAAYLRSKGWAVAEERVWTGSHGRKSGRLRYTEGHEAHSWTFRAEKPGANTITHSSFSYLTYTAQDIVRALQLRAQP